MSSTNDAAGAAAASAARTSDDAKAAADAVDGLVRSDSVMTRRRLEKGWLDDYLRGTDGHAAQAKAKAVESVHTALKNMVENLEDKGGAAGRMNALRAAMEGKSKARAFLRDCGGLAVAVHVMAVCLADAEVQVAGCKLLEVAAEDEKEVQDVIGKCEGIDSILDAMKSHRSKVDVQDAAAGALRSLTWVEGNRKTMLNHGGMGDLVEALRLHPDSPALQEHVICTIAHGVFGNEQGRQICGKVGAVQAIVKAMTLYPSNVSLQAQCCFALRNLSWQCPENTALMLEHAADDQLIAAMERYPRIPGVQDQALAALSNIMIREVQSLKKVVAEESKLLLTVIFKALATFTGNASITGHAQLLLISLADVGKTIGHPVALKKIASYPDAAKIILRSLVAPPEKRAVSAVAHAATLMKHLCPMNEFQTDVRANDGLALFLSCVEQFAEKETGKTCALLEGLNAICSGSDEAKAEFNNIGGVGKISALMLQLPNVPLFQERCCMVLDNISNGQFEATAANMKNRPEAMRSVVAAMILYPHSAPLQEHACSVMIKVAASSEDDSNDLCALGARPVVEKARAGHSGNPAVESLANQLLTLLVPTGDGSREGRGQTPRGSSSARLRSRSRTVQTGQRSRSRMDRSKSREKKRGPAFGGLDAVDENSTGDGGDLPELGAKPKRHPGSKPESRKGPHRGGGREPIKGLGTNTLESFEEE